MAHDNKTRHCAFRHTVRFKKLVDLLVDRPDVQTATLIQNMALRAAENELQKLGIDGQSATGLGMHATC